jgi:ADP-heptose:LPS heptosyltransferase
VLDAATSDYRHRAEGANAVGRDWQRPFARTIIRGIMATNVSRPAVSAPGRRAEILGRWILLRALFRGLRGGRLPDWSRAQTLLYVRQDGVGDLIMATGLLGAIKRAHPALTIDVLTRPANVEVLENNPDVRAVFSFGEAPRWRFPVDVLRRVRAAHYDVVIDGMVDRVSDGRWYDTRVRFRTIVLMLVARAGYRIGLAGREGDAAYNIRVPGCGEGLHHVEHSAATAAAFGIDRRSTDLRPRLFPSVAEHAAAETYWAQTTAADGSIDGPRVLVNVSANNVRRRWPEAAYREALVLFVALRPDARVLVNGGPEDRERAARIADGVGVAVGPTLREAFALVASATLLATPDTSMAHAASAFDTRAVVLLARDACEYEPYRTKGRNLYSDGETVESIRPEDFALAMVEALVECEVATA